MRELLLLIAILTISITSFAEENRNFFPMGEKELFSGNAGTAGIGSSAASYFNPAALTQIKTNKLSISASAFYYSKIKREPTANIETTPVNYEASSFSSVPSSINTVMNFKGWVGAFSIMVPFSQNYENQEVWTLNNNKRVYWEEKREESNLLIGGSAAKKLNDQWSVGFSVFAQKLYELEMSSYTNLAENENVSGEIESIRVQSNAWLASLIFGVLYEDKTLDWGLKLQTPTIQISGSGDYYESQISGSAGAGSYRDDVVNKKGAEVTQEVPADISIGINYHATSKLNILVDLSYQLSGKYEQFSDPVIVVAYNQQENNNTIEYKAQYRVNVAIEYFPTDKIDLLAGVYYVPSASPSTSEQMDGIGFATGGYYATKNTKSGLGIFGLSLSGDHPVEGQTQKGKTTFSIMGAVLSTSYNF